MKTDPELVPKYDETFNKQPKLGFIKYIKNLGKIYQTPKSEYFISIRTRLNFIPYLMSLKTCNVDWNDCILKGSNITLLIIDIISRFILFQIAIIADIEKTFLQLGIKETNRGYLRFLWVISTKTLKVKETDLRVLFSGWSRHHFY